MILMVLVASCSDYSVRALIKLGKQADKHYYEQLVQSQFGHAGALASGLALRLPRCCNHALPAAGYVAVSAAMGIFAYGAMCAYLIGISASLRVLSCRHAVTAATTLLLHAGGTMSLVFGHWAGVDVIAHPWVTRAVLIVISGAWPWRRVRACR